MDSPRGALTEIVEVVVLALGLYLVITFAVQTVHVIGLSMYPTVDDQDYLIATKIDYRLHPPQRGDIIIMRDPYDSSRDFIKRVIALPGEELLIRSGRIYINGRLLDEPYLAATETWSANTDWPAAAPGGANQPYRMGPQEYFVMGDNRNHSSDSRLFGPVDRGRIEAHAWVRVLPITHFGPIGGPPPKLEPASTGPPTAEPAPAWQAAREAAAAFL
jgi:signal peptidase I